MTSHKRDSKPAPATAAAATAPPVVEEVLHGPSQPLDPATRAFMEPRFEQDFSSVRVHTGTHAAESAASLGAAAYTVGNHVVFGAGKFSPHSEAGRKVLAHELAHVAQPKGSGVAAGVGSTDSATETDADRVADVVAAGGVARPTVATEATIQRQPDAHVIPPLTGSVDLLDDASPFLAASVGSVLLDDFDTGKSDLKPAHQRLLAATAKNIQKLLQQFPLSTLTVIGHADTVGADEKNLALGAARAAAVKQALIDLGIADSIITASSRGEGAPQAQKTADEVPSARNGGVEVRFHPQGKRHLGPLSPSLVMPPPSGRAPTPPPQPRPLPRVPTPGPGPPPKPRWFEPNPPQPRGVPGTGKSPVDVFAEWFLDPVIDNAPGLRKSVREAIKDAVRTVVTTGVAKSVRAAAKAAGLSDETFLEALENAAEQGFGETKWFSK